LGVVALSVQVALWFVVVVVVVVVVDASLMNYVDELASGKVV
jgi:hypothetical protein